MPEINTPKGKFPDFLDRIQVEPPATAPGERLWSAPEGNTHAPLRDLYRRVKDGPFLNEYHPPAADEIDGHSRGTLHLYVGPGEGASKFARRFIAAHRRRLEDPALFPERIEIEFSATPAGTYPAAEGTPEDYRLFAIDWAIETCPVVALCVDQEPGTVAGEPHRVIGNLQVTFRTPSAHASAWEDFLRRRLRKRHRFAVVRVPTEGA